MIDTVLKILAFCLIIGGLGITLKPKANEFTFLISVAAGIIILNFVFKAVSEPVRQLADKLNGYGIEIGYFKVALKAVGLSFITDFVASSCRDSGQASLASKAELVGKTAIFLLSVPLLMSVLDTAVGFVK